MRRQGPLSRSKPARGSQRANAVARKKDAKKKVKVSKTKPSYDKYYLGGGGRRGPGVRPLREYGQMD